MRQILICFGLLCNFPYLLAGAHNAFASHCLLLPLLCAASRCGLFRTTGDDGVFPPSLDGDIPALLLLGPPLEELLWEGLLLEPLPPPSL